MTLLQLLPLIKSRLAVFIEELPSAHKYVETVLNTTLEYSWQSINEFSKTTHKLRLSPYANCLVVDPVTMDTDQYMNLEVTDIVADEDTVCVYVKYKGL